LSKEKYPKETTPEYRVDPARRSFCQGLLEGASQPLQATRCFPASPLRAVPAKTSGARRDITGNCLFDFRSIEMNCKQLIDQAISLPVEERALMVDSLLRSLNPSESEIDKKWLTIAERRLADMRAGKVQAVQGQEVFEKIWNRFEK
jgi:putative addiction module component (TIGR02574 family)